MTNPSLDALVIAALGPTTEAVAAYPPITDDVAEALDQGVNEWLDLKAEEEKLKGRLADSESNVLALYRRYGLTRHETVPGVGASISPPRRSFDEGTALRLLETRGIEVPVGEAVDWVVVKAILKSKGWLDSAMLAGTGKTGLRR